VEGRAKLSRRDKELAALAPWAWDPNVGKHKPGRAMMRDFSEARAPPRRRARPRTTRACTLVLAPFCIPAVGGRTAPRRSAAAQRVAPAASYAPCARGHVGCGRGRA
jgi:hypothetical protein